MCAQLEVPQRRKWLLLPSDVRVRAASQSPGCLWWVLKKDDEELTKQKSGGKGALKRMRPKSSRSLQEWLPTSVLLEYWL